MILNCACKTLVQSLSTDYNKGQRRSSAAELTVSSDEHHMIQLLQRMHLYVVWPLPRYQVLERSQFILDSRHSTHTVRAANHG